MISPPCRAVLGIVLTAALWGCETQTPYVPWPGARAPLDTETGPPTFTPGDEFWFHRGAGSIVLEVFTGMEDGLLVFRRDLENETRYYSRGLSLVKVLRPLGTDRWFDPDDGVLDFPLAVGKTWTRTFDTWTSRTLRRVQRRRACEVVDAGQATVPGGSFAAYRIDCTLRELAKAPVVHEEFLYAPAVGRIIQHYTADDGIVSQLTEFTRAPAPPAGN